METTYSNARQQLARLMDKVSEGREVVIINRRGKKASQRVALVSADELEGLMETAHLMRSPKNAHRLLTAIGRALRGKTKPQSLDALRRETGLG